MARKTFEVEAVLDHVNNMLKTNYWSKETRIGMFLVLENILHNTGNYNGFRYLSNLEVGDGMLPGVRFDEETRLILTYPERFENTDDTRREYY